jgi:predicted amidohydrolase YtcJ
MRMPRSPFRPPPAAGLREAHAHLAQHGLALTMLDLASCGSAADMLDRIAARAASDDPGVSPARPLLAGGARPESCPFCAWCFDYHALIANTAALRAAGVDEATPDDPGGIFVRDGSGRLTGVAYEHAATRVWDAVVGGTLRDRAILDAAARSLAGLGFTEVHDLKAQRWLGPELRAIDRAEGLPLGVRLWPLVADLPVVAGSRSAWETDAVTLAGGKIFVDGTLNSRTAWMLDYATPRPRGAPGIRAGWR